MNRVRHSVQKTTESIRNTAAAGNANVDELFLIPVKGFAIIWDIGYKGFILSEMPRGRGIMKWLKRLLLVTVMMTVSVNIVEAKSPRKKNQAEVTESTEIPAPLQGEWTIIAHSYNKGVTTDFDDPPYTLAYVSNNTATLGNGRVISVKKVVRTKGDNGDPIDAIMFKNGVLWAVSAGKEQAAKQQMWMVQVYQQQEEDEIVETTRVIVKVLKNKDKYTLPSAE